MEDRIMEYQKLSVDEMIETLPRNEKVIVKRLRALVRECLPKAEEKNSWGICLYTRHRMIVFIWPPYIYWDKKKKDVMEKGVSLGFCQGNRMANDDGALLAEGRKQIYCMYFKSVNEINENLIRSLLFEAEMVDETFGAKKRRK